jgi:hypothetical protein
MNFKKYVFKMDPHADLGISDDDDCGSQSSWSSSIYEKVREEAHNQGIFDSKYARGRKHDEWISSQFEPHQVGVGNSLIFVLFL